MARGLQSIVTSVEYRGCTVNSEECRINPLAKVVTKAGQPHYHCQKVEPAF